MEKRRIITIAGRPGSGKSTTSKALARALQYDHFSSGDLFREIISNRGLEVLQANQMTEEITEVDHMVDGRLREIGETANDIVIDSRMAWHWIPNSFKVYLDLDLQTAAERILAKTDESRMQHENVPQDPKEYADLLGQRLKSEEVRYKHLYAVNPYDTANYDLVVDTKANSVERCVGSVVDAYTAWLNRA